MRRTKPYRYIRRSGDMNGTAAMFPASWFPPRMLEAQAPFVEEFRSMLLATSRQGLAGMIP